MRLYSGSSKQFITDAIQNQIADKLKSAFFDYFHFLPSPGEITSWRNSLKSLSQLFQHAQLMDHGVILEYQLPLSSKRLDCLIAGKSDQNDDNAVIIELKQWENCSSADGDNEVITWLGGAEREVLHPAVQVGQYKMYLEDTHTSFYEDPQPVLLNACTYLHNYRFVKDDVLLSPKFQKILQDYPLFSMDDVDQLSDFLSRNLLNGQGGDVLRRIEGGKYRPSKKLMEHVAGMVKGNPEYVLLDEQLVAYDRVITSARAGFHDRRKSVIIIKGGPGTGKSVIAINLMADLLSDGYNAHYATGSRAFTETLRKIIGSRGAIQFKYFNSYTDAARDDVDVLICDEAHRIRKTSQNRFTPKSQRTDVPQIQEIINTGKVSVFFIDDVQVVRPNEIGSVDYIKSYAQEKDCLVHEYELETQFRCSGSDAFVNWIDMTLDIRKTANVIWTGEDPFDFRIFNSPQELEDMIRRKATEGFSARMTAGFCWDWSKQKSDGTLNNDVVIDDFQRPWNARPEATRLAKGIPKATLWAYDPNGINQIGCIYTAQGFEFDYVGVIFGDDLKYNLDEQKWEGFPENSGDTVVKRAKGRFIDLVKNTYRVLLSRGLKGCFVYFTDKDTERFFKSRMELTRKRKKTEKKVKPKLISYVNALPLIDMGVMEDVALLLAKPDFENWKGNLVEVSGGPYSEDCFAIRQTTDEMEPEIPKGSLCVLRLTKGAIKDGEIILCMYKGYSIKESVTLIRKYQRFRIGNISSVGETSKIILSPINSAYPAIEIREGADEFHVLGIFDRVIENK